MKGRGGEATCIPVPPAVDLGGVNAAIAAEKAAREGMDGLLAGQIQDLREALTETSIVGRWAFSGTQNCLNSSRNFDQNFLPVMPPQAPPPIPGQTQLVPTTFVQTSSSTVWGSRTFNADGTGLLELEFVSTNHIPLVYVNFTGTPSASLSTTLPSASSGVQSSVFQWRLDEGKIVIDDNDPNSVGKLTSGARKDWFTIVVDLPLSVAVPGKDARVLTTTSQGPSVERSILRSPAEVTPPQELVTPRICHRERVLRKM